MSKKSHFLVSTNFSAKLKNLSEKVNDYIAISTGNGLSIRLCSHEYSWGGSVNIGHFKLLDMILAESNLDAADKESGIKLTSDFLGFKNQEELFSFFDVQRQLFDGVYDFSKKAFISSSLHEFSDHLKMLYERIDALLNLLPEDLQELGVMPIDTPVIVVHYSDRLTKIFQSGFRTCNDICICNGSVINNRSRDLLGWFPLLKNKIDH